MFTSRVVIRIVEWRDPEFTRAVVASWRSLIGGPIALDRAEAAHCAVIEYGRSAEDPSDAAHWTVHRDGSRRSDRP
jgi:hypothetical protein